MKSLLAITAFLVLLGVSLATLSCNYVAEDKQWIQYDLSNLETDRNHWLNGTDNNGNVWYWKVCTSEVGVPDGQDSPCGDSISAACVSQKGNPFESRGNFDSALWSDSRSGTDGVEVVFTGDVCSNDATQNVKTVIDYVCSADSEDYTSEIKSDGCFTTITVYTSDACRDQVMYDGSWADGDDYQTHSYQSFFLGPFVSMIGLLGLCICLVSCCCCMRRRRCQRKAIAMKQFSNVAFQPIPQTHSAIKQQQNIPMVQIHPPSNQIPLPSYNPFVVQQPHQPYVYYYPNQQQQTQQQPQVNHQVQLSSDEQLAKELQSQFDRESRV